MKPAEYAKELGISRQAVYAKIKRGVLTARNIEGKLYVSVDNEGKDETKESEKETVVKPVTTTPVKTNVPQTKIDTTDYKALLEAKDETITVLKGTVKDLKKSNKQISSTLKGEIDLLKEAFHEMRTLYVRQIEQKKTSLSDQTKVEEEAIDVMMEDSPPKNEHVKEESPEKKVLDGWISTKKFFKQHKITKEKQQEKIEKRLKKVAKLGDKRVIAEKGKIKVNSSLSYKDIIRGTLK